MAVVSSLVRPPQPAIAGHFAARLPRLRRWFRSLLAVALLLNAVAAFAQDSDTVTLNFVNADIDAVVKAVGEITGRNFLVDPRVKGTVNIVSARPVAKALVYPTSSRPRCACRASRRSKATASPRSFPKPTRRRTAGLAATRATVSASGADRIVTQVDEERRR